MNNQKKYSKEEIKLVLKFEMRKVVNDLHP